MNVDFKHVDERGELIQLVHLGFEQINVLESRKGVVRGGHYHKESVEAFYVVRGSVILTSSYKGVREQECFRTGDFFRVPVGVVHSMEFPENCLMVQMYDKCVDKGNGKMDIYAEGE